MTVESVEDTGEWHTVYNLRVADYHTYFVGSPEWGFAVWAHNAECTVQEIYAELDRAGVARDQKGRSSKAMQQALSGDADTLFNYLQGRYPDADPAVLRGVVDRIGSGQHRQLPIDVAPEAPANAEVGWLEYRHSPRGGNPVPEEVMLDQINGQVNGLNRIIQEEGLAGLKARIRAYMAEAEASEAAGRSNTIDTAGRVHTRRLSQALGEPPDGQVWLHEPDMAVGGRPTDVFRYGDARADFVLGGQTNRIAADILALPDTVNWIQARYTPLYFP